MPYEHFRYAKRVDADAVKLLNSSNVECLQYKKTGAGVTTLSGQLLTTNELHIKADSADTYPFLSLVGNGAIYLQAAGSASIQLRTAGAAFLSFSDSSGAQLLTHGDRDLFLNPAGTGKVKFGTKTGTGDVAVDGYVSIRDSAGNAVKLATVA